MPLFRKRKMPFVWQKLYSKTGPIVLRINQDGKIEVTAKKTYTHRKYVSGLWD